MHPAPGAAVSPIPNAPLCVSTPAHVQDPQWPTYRPLAHMCRSTNFSHRHSHAAFTVSHTQSLLALLIHEPESKPLLLCHHATLSHACTCAAFMLHDSCCLQCLPYCVICYSPMHLVTCMLCCATLSFIYPVVVHLSHFPLPLVHACTLSHTCRIASVLVNRMRFMQIQDLF